jgi:3-oxoadipate enol-lactonase/4-carboxymuconolactone decarboxylase
MVSSTNPEGYIACCAALRDADLRPYLGRIATHALVVAGEHDTTTTLADAEYIYSQLRSARQVTLPGAHLTNVECADDFSRHAGQLFAVADTGMARLDRALRASRTLGDATRRRVLGDAHVNRAIQDGTPLTADFQDLITRYVWGEIWTRPGLDERTRRILVIGTMVALGRWEEFAMHVRAAVEHGGFGPDDIKEIVLQQAVYCGVPAANHALKIAGEVLARDRA